MNCRKKVPHAKREQLYADTTDLLNELAYNAHARQPKNEAGTADIAESELLEKLCGISDDPEIRPMRLIQFLSNRSGLLIPRGVGIFSFPHRTFQEYLAACYLTENEFPEKIAELTRTEPDRWREVCLLAGAKQGAGVIWSLADHLCFTSPPPPLLKGEGSSGDPSFPTSLSIPLLKGEGIGGDSPFPLREGGKGG